MRGQRSPSQCQIGRLEGVGFHIVSYNIMAVPVGEVNNGITLGQRGFSKINDLLNIELTPLVAS